MRIKSIVILMAAAFIFIGPGSSLADVEFAFVTDRVEINDKGLVQSVALMARSTDTLESLGGFQVDFTFGGPKYGTTLLEIESQTIVPSSNLAVDYSEQIREGKASVARMISMQGNDPGIFLGTNWRTLAVFHFYTRNTDHGPVPLKSTFSGTFDGDFNITHSFAPKPVLLWVENAQTTPSQYNNSQHTRKPMLMQVKH